MTHLSQFFNGRMHRGWTHPFLALLFLACVGVAAGVLVWALLRGAPRSQHHVPAGPPPDPALETLRLRFARGEIDADEYAARAALLSGAVPPGPPPPVPAAH